jgi:hypothetical protein
VNSLRLPRQITSVCETSYAESADHFGNLLESVAGNTCYSAKELDIDTLECHVTLDGKSLPACGAGAAAPCYRVQKGCSPCEKKSFLIDYDLGGATGLTETFCRVPGKIEAGGVCLG